MPSATWISLLSLIDIHITRISYIAEKRAHICFLFFSLSCLRHQLSTLANVFSSLLGTTFPKLKKNLINHWRMKNCYINELKPLRSCSWLPVCTFTNDQEFTNSHTNNSLGGESIFVIIIIRLQILSWTCLTVKRLYYLLILFIVCC